MLANPKLAAKAKPEIEVPEEFKNKWVTVVLLMFVQALKNNSDYRSGVANKILEEKEKKRALTEAVERKRKRSDRCVFVVHIQQ